jgi:hypothetical protein
MTRLSYLFGRRRVAALLGVLASGAISLILVGSPVYGATLCLSHHGTRLRTVKSRSCERRETSLTVATSVDITTLTTRVAALEAKAASVQALNDLTTRVKALESRVVSASELNALTARVAALEATASRLQAANDRLQALFAGVTRTGDTLLFSHMNLQVESGSGSTDGPVNGLGNVIIGYNEFPGTQTGSHNLVIGHGQSFTSFGGTVAGINNSISAPWASVLGGFDNQASGSFASVLTGLANTASGNGSSIGGGNAGTASGIDSFIAGGTNNRASGAGSFVGGGRDNAAAGPASSILGGVNITLTNANATSP